MAKRMTLYDKQAFSILKSLYNTLTNREVTVANYGDYINVFQKLRDFYRTDTDFQSAVFTDIFAKTGKVVWQDKEYAGNPYSFVHREYDNLLEFITRGYVFSRDCDENTIPDKYFLAGKTVGETGYNEEQLTKWEQMRWKGKEYPTEVRGTTGKADLHDSLIYYRRWIMDSMTEPYEFYNMWGAVKRSWEKHWKSWLAQWDRVCFMNLLFSTATDSSRQIHLITEYNAKFGTSLTSENWFIPENVKAFAPWAYIRLNEIKRVMSYDNNLYMRDNKTTFRGKEYEYTYSAKALTDVFLREPFLLMKSYSNAEVYNENDIASVDLHEIDFWETPTDKYRLKSGKVYVWNDAKKDYELKASEATVKNLLGVIYDPDAIGTTTYNERHYDTGLNEVTEHGVLHVHCNMTNYYNPMLKAVAVFLD